MIDFQNEQMLSLSQAAKLLPSNRSGRPVSLGCLLRWVLSGVRLPDGATVRLEAVRLGGRWLTSVEALQRFADRQTPRLEGEQESPRQRSASKRALDRVDREL